MAQGLGELGHAYKVKHSRYSNLKNRRCSARATAGGDDRSRVQRDHRQVVRLACHQRAVVAATGQGGAVPADKGRSRTLATNERDSLQRLYHFDNRAAPWQGTAFAVLQAFNTYAHHESMVRGTERAERNMTNAVLGVTEASDAEILAELAQLADRPRRTAQQARADRGRRGGELALGDTRLLEA